MDVSLDLNATTLIIQIVATTLLFLIVRFFFAKPIKDFMEKRKAFVQASFDEAKVAKLEASKIRQELDEELTKFKAESRQRLEEETLKAKTKADSIVDAAKEKAAIEMDKAQAKIEKDRNSMLIDAQAEIITIAKKATEKLIRKEIDADVHDDLFDEFVKLVGGNHE